MFEYYNNILCVHGGWLVDEGVVSISNFKQLCLRGHFEKLTTGGNGRKALIKFDTIRKDIKEKIIAITGDPTEKAKHITFIDYIKTDHAADDFFNRHTLDNGEPLPEKNKAEYKANAEVLNAIDHIMSSTMGKRKALGSKVKPWPKIAEVVAELPQHRWPHSLPGNEKRLRDKYNLYKKEGYVSLIHKGFGHKNSEKLEDDAKRWVLARWADRVQKCPGYSHLLREYNSMAQQTGWKPLKAEQTLINFLTDPKIEPLWHGYRFGELKSKEKYTFQFSTKMPGNRDGLWYSDGTKLNYYYRENGKMQTCNVYEVFDAYSEVFLGFHISKTEDYQAQYQAYKMALQISGYKPYEVKFDNQGGHKKLETNSFLGQISKLCTNTAPHNGKSKTIENAFYRFQSQFLKQDWFFTGQNITAKKDESKANMELILRNVASLPTLDEVKKVYAQRRKEWNEAPHPKSGISRIEMYLNSENPASQSVTIWDMISMFWIQRDKPVTCTAYGISFKEKGIKYTYIRYKENGQIDFDWLGDNIDRKFVIKFDPDDMTTVQLYTDTPLGLRHAGPAALKIEVQRGRQEQEAGEAAFIAEVLEANKKKRIERADTMHQLMVEQGRTEEDYGLRSPLLQGVNSSRAKQKKAKQIEVKAETTTIGQYQKALSEVVADTETADVVDVYKMM